MTECRLTHKHFPFSLYVCLSLFVCLYVCLFVGLNRESDSLNGIELMLLAFSPPIRGWSKKGLGLIGPSVNATCCV